MMGGESKDPSAFAWPDHRFYSDFLQTTLLSHRQAEGLKNAGGQKAQNLKKIVSGLIISFYTRLSSSPLAPSAPPLSEAGGRGSG